MGLKKNSSMHSVFEYNFRFINNEYLEDGLWDWDFGSFWCILMDIFRFYLPHDLVVGLFMVFIPSLSSIGG